MRSGGQIKVGDVLNHIYEVRRFIARGGMGEVYEGVNVNNPVERAAIKVMLPALASDPNILAMFRKEATTLIRLSHPALVQYRLLAQEPRLGVFYIVTDYIEGANLADVIRTVPRDAASLAGLMRRLADGLRAAHALGAVHRDISPDNVILEQGDFERARIIDFGIAKDLDPTKVSIIGDGFAGKLGYVAPEQLGEYGRKVGPWSDVYSLALVIRAVAAGGEAEMGATLVEAIDRRRAPIDLSAVPEPLRPVLSAMLQADPEKRIRSMAEVIAALANLGPVTTAAKPTATASEPTVVVMPERPVADRSSDARPTLLERARALPPAAMVAGFAAAIALGGMGYWASDRSTAAPPSTAASGTVASGPEDSARTALAQVLPTVACSWLDIETIGSGPGGLTVGFKGVARDRAGAQSAITDALGNAGLTLDRIDFADVETPGDGACTLLDAVRQVKSPPPGDLSIDRFKWEKAIQKMGKRAGESAAVPQVHLSAAALGGELMMSGIAQDGSAETFIGSTAALRDALADASSGSLNPDGSATIKVLSTDEGLAGFLLIHGKAAIDSEAVFPAGAQRDEAWAARFVEQARANGWSTDMVWFKIVNEAPDVAPGR